MPVARITVPALKTTRADRRIYLRDRYEAGSPPSYAPVHRLHMTIRSLYIGLSKLALIPSLELNHHMLPEANPYGHVTS